MPHTPPALLLDRPTVARLLSLDDCIEAVADAFAAHARGETLSPGLLHGDGVGGEYHIKAGGLRAAGAAAAGDGLSGEGLSGDATPSSRFSKPDATGASHPQRAPDLPGAYYACKVNSSFFQNRATNGLPNIQGLILLYDATNGRPLAVMESAEITIKRTGAATAVAARHLTRKDARVATIAGAGIQGAIQLESLARACRLEQAFVWSRDVARASVLAERMTRKLGFAVEARSDLGAAMRASDVIVTCTPAKHWLIGCDMVRPGTFIAAVGADSPDKQEIEPQLLAQSAVVTDLTEQCAHVGDLHHAIAAGLMKASDVRGQLGDIIVGRVPGRKDEQEVIVYDATGTALQDVAAAARVYEKARSAGAGMEFPFWGPA